MKFVIQRVTHAEVAVEGEVIGKIGKGFMVLIGVAQDDSAQVLLRQVHRIWQMNCMNILLKNVRK